MSAQVYKEEGSFPVKAWVDGVPFDDHSKAQLRNVSKLPFIHKHVAVLPDVHAGIGATIGSVIPTRGAIIPAAVGVDLGCFIGSTLIPLVDGTQHTLLELSEKEEPFLVYSVSGSSIVPGKAKAVKTRENAKLIEVCISGGARIVCTPDHEFMLRDGSYKRADTLSFKDSLMPLYRKYETRDGYESIRLPSGKVRSTHKLFAEFTHGKSEGRVVHHKDHNLLNNEPVNLEYMTASEHSKLHRAKDDSITRFKSDSFKRNRLKKLRENGFFSDYEKKSADSTKNLLAGQEKYPEKFAENYAKAGIRGAKNLASLNVSPKQCGFCDTVLPNLSSYQWHVRREHNNHKVTGIRELETPADVYCLQVEEYHNFALSAGVFVHNCGMMAVRTTLRADQLPDNLKEIRSAIEAGVPHGRTDNGGANDRGAWGVAPKSVEEAWASMEPKYREIVDKNGRVSHKRPHCQLGTLGGGNHFVEVCLDQEDRVWVMLHSGSRGVGNTIGSYFIEQAKKEMERWFINLPDMNLAYLAEGSKYFNDYVEAVGWAQEYALANRQLMMQATLQAMAKSKHLPAFELSEEAVNCHHNYIAKENHFHADVWVTRKGAIRARKKDLGIIPGSMGAKSFIVRGKGCAESFCSASHGAGRVMSRTEAKNKFTIKDHEEATRGVECRKDAEVIDEIPMAYKSIDAVMKAQDELVEVLHTLKQIVCVKG